MGWIVSPPWNTHVEVLTPRTSDAGCTWRWGLKEWLSSNEVLRVGLDPRWLRSLQDEEIYRSMTQEADDHSQARETGRRRNQLCQPLDFRLLAARILRKLISVVKPPCLWHFIMAALVIWCPSGRSKNNPQRKDHDEKKRWGFPGGSVTRNPPARGCRRRGFDS